LFSLVPLTVLVVREASAGREAITLLYRSGAGALLLRSLVLSSVVTILALALGMVMAVAIARTDVRGFRTAAVLHAFPAFLPPFLLALGWFHLLGASGLVGSEATSRALFSEVGVVAVLVIAFAPIATALVALGLLSIDPSLEEAARVVAKPVRVVAAILIPAAAPAWVLAAIVIFTLSFSELGVPMFLRVDTFPAAVFSRLGGIDYAPGEALALVLPLVPVALALLAVERRLVGARSYAVLGPRSVLREAISLGRWRRIGSAAVWLVALTSIMPIVALAWRAVAGGGLRQVGSWLGGAPWNSLSSAVVAATVISAIGLVVGHAAARRRARAGGLDAAAVLAFSAPAAVMGIGLIAIWNRPALQWAYGSAAILVVGYVARYAVIGIRAIGSLVAQTPLDLEESAACVGADYWRRLTRILLPLHWRGIGFAWLLALVFCLRDLEMAVLYYPPGGEPLSVRIFTLEANGPESVVAALALVLVGLTAAALCTGGWLLRRRAA
jgi:iron(III) transport system permease protein